MPGDEHTKAKERAAKQAEERDRRQENRNQAQNTSTTTSSNLPIVTLLQPDLQNTASSVTDSAPVNTTSHIDSTSTDLKVSVFTPSPATIVSNPDFAKSIDRKYYNQSTIMAEYQYKAVIDSIPTFAGESREKVNDWIEIVSLKFDILAYEPAQRRRFIPQYLAGNALKWHLAHRDHLTDWNEYIAELRVAFPQVITTSRDMNLKMLCDRKQGDTEAFTDYYASVVELCCKHNPDMAENQIIDWLKAGMKLNLYERLQCEDFITPQTLLIRAQRLELDNNVLEARKRENAQSSTVGSNSSKATSRYSGQRDQSTYYQPPATPIFTPSYPPPLPPLMSTPFPYAVPDFTSNNQSSYSSFPSPRHPIICYTCGQPGHISPRCPSRPKY